jgi:hypothetical protein
MASARQLCCEKWFSCTHDLNTQREQPEQKLIRQSIPIRVDSLSAWWGRWGSNPRPSDYESRALTN